MKNKNSFIVLILFSIAVALAVFVYCRSNNKYFESKNKLQINTNTNVMSENQTGNSNEVVPWKTYTNDKILVGFQFQYPSEYEIYSRAEDNQNTLSLASANPRYLFLAKSGLQGQSFTKALLHIEVNPTSFKNLDAFQADLEKNYRADYNNGAINSMPILSRVKTSAAGSGEDVLKLSDEGGQTSAYYLFNNKTLVVIEPAFPLSEETKRVVNGLLSSFRFIFLER